ncbi:B12-binding domain-containing radical SAM protein [Sorangium cellulosum]|uniref:Radical SAM protein n=3 Tax=Sorangium cellulosum TaxID=56 RepID=A0A150TW84_SORCE|nr:radical SAM protein [Sorangium cellulosum]AGP32958.1 radical SAM protein [Sorangium cellulosum So0157-2]KYG08969.1 radical SAM protein [Sorangium cellulosum]
MSRSAMTTTIRRRLASEIGRIDKQAPFRVALSYPSPYRAGMSSLGFLQIYKLIQAEPGMACERAFLPDDEGVGAEGAPVTYEGLRPLSDFPVIALSVAYELELAGVVRLLELAGLPALREERDGRHPFVLAGGPLTFSNPLPLAPFVDAILMGEADTLAVEVLRLLRDAPSREAALDALAGVPHVFVPARHGAEMPPVARCDDALLPAWSPIRAEETELSNMFLIEAERGCSRGCTYCVMRRSTNGGMRIVPKDRLLELVPEDARRVGLVGAAVSDHPKIVEVVRTLAERGCEVGLSSLRPDRLTDEFVGALRLAGYKTLTTAMDGTSERVRETLERRARPRHLQRAAELARQHGMNRLKLYLMVGVPGETDADVDECVAFVTELSRIVPVALGIAPFCPKRNTPLHGARFAGIDVVNKRLDRLRRGLRGRADVRATSARWAWVEAVLAAGGEAEGRAVLQAVHAGGSFRDYERAFERIKRPEPPRQKSLPLLAAG